MSNLIQIKRSQTNGSPPSLANGELAWTAAGEVLFIGDYGTNRAIGGARNPGILTANQALVANSTSGINNVIANNITITHITTGGTYNPGAGFVLSVDANGNTYWEDPTTVGVSTSYVQNTDSRVLSGNLHFTGANTYINNLYATNATISDQIFVGSVVANNVTLTQLEANGTVGSTGNILYSDGANAYWGDISLAIPSLANYIQNTDSRVVSGNLHFTSTNTYFDYLNGGTTALDNLSVNTYINANTGTFYHNLNVGGDLYVTGNLISSDVTVLNVESPLLHLGTNNTVSDTLDIGFYSDYSDDAGATIRYSGLVRDASDKVFKLFYGLTDAPQTYVNTSSASYQQATLDAYLNSGALVSNSTSLSITATNDLHVTLVANTLTLSTALAASYGGTGYKVYTQGDILTGNSTSGLEKLSLGTSGYVLQSDGTKLVYGTLDGGSF